MAPSRPASTKLAKRSKRSGKAGSASGRSASGHSARSTASSFSATSAPASADSDAPRELRMIQADPEGDHQWTLVYLHGFGCGATALYEAHVDGLKTLEKYGVRVVLPFAPRRPITFMHGKPVRGWYDYTTNSHGLREDLPEPSTLAESVRSLHAIFEAEIEMLGGDASRLLVGGVSQGAITGLEAVMRFPRPLGAFLGTAGVFSQTPLRHRTVPLFLFCGDEDKVHRWSWVKPTITRLESFSDTIILRRFPACHAMMCSDCAQPLLKAFLRAVCGPRRGDPGDAVDRALMG